MVTVERLEIKGFRGIREGRLRLAPLTLLVGPNNSGKTAILEALFLAPNPFRLAPYMHGWTALEALHSLHQTLDSAGYAFLLHNYTATQASIACDKFRLTFTRDNDRISVTVNRRVPVEKPEEGAIAVEGVEEKPFTEIGHLSYSTSNRRWRTQRLVSGWDAPLVTGSLAREAMEYVRSRWATLWGEITRRVAKAASKALKECYLDLTMEPSSEDAQVSTST